MALLTYACGFEYRNNDGSPVDLSAHDVIVSIHSTDFSGASNAGVELLLEDGNGDYHHTDQNFAVASLPDFITFDRAGYSAHVDLTDIVFMRVAFGTDGASYEEAGFVIGTEEIPVGGGGGGD